MSGELRNLLKMQQLQGGLNRAKVIYEKSVKIQKIESTLPESPTTNPWRLLCSSGIGCVSFVDDHRATI